MSRELSPTFRRYWIKVLDNDQCISQFDPEGNYILWDQTIPAKKVMFVPFSTEFAAKCKSKGNSCEPSNLPILEFEIKNNVQYHRNCTIRHRAYISCNFCGAVLDESDKICPCCLGQNWYYCDLCDELKSDPKKIDGNLLCPDCDEPRGLLWVGCIIENAEETLDSVHALDFDDEHHLILDLVKV